MTNAKYRREVDRVQLLFCRKALRKIRKNMICLIFYCQVAIINKKHQGTLYGYRRIEDQSSSRRPRSPV